jgi:hypothetical protein
MMMNRMIRAIKTDGMKASEVMKSFFIRVSPELTSSPSICASYANSGLNYAMQMFGLWKGKDGAFP